MTLHEKLERLTAHSNRTGVAKAAGLSSGALHSLLKRKYDPQISTIKAIAGVLEIDPSWLIDDRQAWPPVYTKSAAA